MEKKRLPWIMKEDKTSIIKLSYEFSVEIIQFCILLEQKHSIGRTISWQLIRSGTSIGANIEEAQGAQSKADFIAKMSISKKEARETVYWLRLLVDTGLQTDKEVGDLLVKAKSLVNILTSIIKTSRTRYTRNP